MEGEVEAERRAYASKYDDSEWTKYKKDAAKEWISVRDDAKKKCDAATKVYDSYKSRYDALGAKLADLETETKNWKTQRTNRNVCDSNSLFNTEINNFFRNKEYDIQDRQKVVVLEEQQDVKRWTEFYADIKTPLCDAYDGYAENTEYVLNQKRDPEAVDECLSPPTKDDYTIEDTTYDCDKDKVSNWSNDEFWVCTSWPFSYADSLTCNGKMLNEADYTSKMNDFISNVDNFVNQSKIDTFEECTGVDLDFQGLVCRPGDNGCSTVSITDITKECSSCVSERNSDYKEQFSLRDAYLALDLKYQEYILWNPMWSNALTVDRASKATKPSLGTDVNCIFKDRHSFWSSNDQNISACSGSSSISSVAREGESDRTGQQD